MRWSQALIRRCRKPEARRRCRSEGGWLRCSAAAIILSGATQAAPGEPLVARDAASVAALIAMEIASTPDGDVYAIGDAITVSATFDRDVSLDVTHGRPSVDLTIGRHVRRATYVRNPRNARHDVVRFVYVVSDGDADEDGVDVPAGSVRLNRATIRDASKRDAVLEHEGLSGGAGQRVDGVTPQPVDAQAAGSVVRLIWDEALDERSIPRTHAFSVVYADSGAVVASVTGVTVKGRAADLTLDVPVTPDTAVAVSYAPTGDDAPLIRDTAGNAGRAGTAETSPRIAAGRTDPEPAEPRQRNGVRRGLPSKTVREIEDILAAKANRTPSQRKVGSDLLEAARQARLAERRASADGRASGASALARLVEVDIRTDVSPGILERIGDLGGKVVDAVPRYRAIRARLPLRSVETLAEEDEVTTIRTADEPTTHRSITRCTARGRSPNPRRAKDNTSEGDVAHAADVARRTHGVDGTGIGIGVLSDGVGYLGRPSGVRRPAGRRDGFGGAGRRR